MTGVVGVGATLQVGNASSPTTWATIAEVVTISGPEVSSELVEASTLDSASGYKEFITGNQDGGTLSLTLNFVNTAAQRDLRALQGALLASPFRLLLPTSPTSWFYFDGRLVDWSQGAEPNAPMQAEVGIKISGEVTYSSGTAEAWVHNMVTFDGSDSLARGADLTGVTTFDRATVAIKLNLASTSPTVARTICYIDDPIADIVFKVYTDALRRVCFTAFHIPSSTGTNAAIVVTPALTPGVDYMVHIAYRNVTGQQSLRCWLNGVEQANSAVFLNAGTIDAAAAGSNFIIGGQAAGESGGFRGELGLVWVALGTTAAAYVTDPAKFYASGADVYTGDNGELPSGTSPAVMFGQQQTAANWNAGTNRGTGGAFTMSGGVV